MKINKINLTQYFILSTLILSIFLISCKNTDEKGTDKTNKNNTDSIVPAKPKVLESTKAATIYEVNIRQFSEEGTFKAFESHIPRLKELGVKILWLMPIHPIGEKNRKGTLGSYYSVQDYFEVNPDFGTKKEFKELIEEAHKNDMLVILDWVANHTAWDNIWITKSPGWYTKDSTGEIIAPVPDWSDVADLDYEQEAMQNEMIKALKYWVSDFDIDGYRCDVASMVPTDFWNKVRKELDAIKPVFMLAEAESKDLHDYAFDANYAWNLHHIMNEISKGNKTAVELSEYFKNDPNDYGKEVYRMAFTSNHDENSWNGTVFERMPENYKTFAAMSFVVPSMPLIYSGQEVGLDKRLEFFEKDLIEWKANELTDFYEKLTSLKKENEALWNGIYGGEMEILETDSPSKIFAFIRTKNENRVAGIFNLTNEDVTFNFKDENLKDILKDYFTEQEIDLGKPINIKVWEFIIGI